MDRIKKKKVHDILRIVIQLVFLVVFPSAFSSAFAAVKEVFAAFSTGAELSLTPFAKIAIFLLAFTIIFGRYFCGYACAFGTVGDLVYKLSAFIQKKTGKKLPEIPRKSIRYLQSIKYLVLVFVLVLCFMGNVGTVNKNSPWTVFSLVISGKIPGTEYIAAGVLMLLIICGMAVKERFFCQFLCPMGALFSLMPVLPTGQLVRDTEKCIKGCSICERGCPVTLKLGEDDIRDGECIRCNKCISYCPRGSISASHLPYDASSPAAVIIQAAILLAVLKFVL